MTVSTNEDGVFGVYRVCRLVTAFCLSKALVAVSLLVDVVIAAAATDDWWLMMMMFRWRTLWQHTCVRC